MNCFLNLSKPVLYCFYVLDLDMVLKHDELYMTALELSPFMHIAHDLVSVAQRINSCREASTRLAHGVHDGPPTLALLAHGAQDGPPAASQQGQGFKRTAHGVLPGVSPLQQTSLGWPRDGKQILWDSDRLVCVWQHVQRCHIKQGGTRLDLEGLVGKLGLRHPHQRYNTAVRMKFLDLAYKFDNTGLTPSLEGGRPKRDYRRLPFRLSDKIRQILASMPGCTGSCLDIMKALEEDPQVIPHIDRRVHDSYK